MRLVSWVTLVIVIAGGIDLGLLGLTGVEFLGTMLGGPRTLSAQLAYSAIGLAAAYQLIPLSLGLHSSEQTGEGG